jgi:hypothetical protein
MSTPPGPQDPYGSQPPAGGGYGAVPPPPANYYGGGSTPPTPPPPNYLVWAIISVFLCWPLAIPSIIFSTQVNSKWAQGDVAGAQDSSRKAKTFALWATIIGAVAVIGYILLVVAGVLAGVSQGSMG